jgi:uncharacterized BrkB/YihY/UPF0761 family membrane protein
MNRNEPCYGLTFLRCVLATLALILVWLLVAIGVGLLLAMIIQPREGQFFLGIWLDWHAIPGLVIGLAAEILIFRRLTRTAKAKKRRNDTNAA